MIPFHKTLISMLTGQHAIKLMTMHIWWVAAAQAGVALYGAYKSSQAQKAGGQAGRDAGYANAADLLYYAGLNSDLIMGAADRNAQAIMTIGYANAEAVERAAARNMQLYGMQAEEEVRRHVIAEKVGAGEIRAMVGGSGLMTNTGTPANYLRDQVIEGITQREFMIERQNQTLLSMAMDASDKAGIYRLTADENAAVTMSNAEAQSGISMNDAARNAAAMRTNADAGQSAANAQSSATMWSGIGSAIGIGVGEYGSYSSQPQTTPFSSLSAPPTIAQNTPPSLLTQPGYANAPPSSLAYQIGTNNYSGSMPSWYGN